MELNHFLLRPSDSITVQDPRMGGTRERKFNFLPRPLHSSCVSILLSSIPVYERKFAVLY